MLQIVIEKTRTIGSNTPTLVSSRLSQSDARKLFHSHADRSLAFGAASPLLFFFPRIPSICVYIVLNHLRVSPPSRFEHRGATRPK